jgi:hypothetical protein
MTGSEELEDDEDFDDPPLLVELVPDFEISISFEMKTRKLIRISRRLIWMAKTP